ncbi:MAG: response regulator [Cycloclasticus sp.]|jgi:CheY-like chemotaxis protein|uniref:response regulator n=1 Tax=Cycloclasticus TaxID=34067 RepID=UPI00091A1BD1|nr:MULTISPECIES: response regulator [Cycloclasticus]MBV1899833.1 response regulator [Cycloclasticus sp.]SHJ62440.1 Response regulator receiver domain-containing protein [Cycloclasticus pugetii]|tara:strand:+ start:44 stop:466 length:423 start_codon:yes stop_codon:yes gene_type:complete
MKTNSKDVTLLLVEDDDIDAMTIERGFLKQRIANPIVRAYDGIEALELLRSNKVSRPLIILLDLQMPRMGGIEFLKQLRADEALSDLVVFVLTTSKSEEDMLSSYKQHIAGYFIKGDSGEKFLDIVNVLDSYWKIVQLPK